MNEPTSAEIMETVLDFLKTHRAAYSVGELGNRLFGTNVSGGRIRYVLKTLVRHGHVEMVRGGGKSLYCYRTHVKQLPLLQIDLDRW